MIRRILHIKICGIQLKVMPRGKFIAFNRYILKKQKKERLKINELSFQEVRNSPIQEVRKRTIKSKETTRKET